MLENCKDMQFFKSTLNNYDYATLLILAKKHFKKKM
jgi:hypothetical protein